LVNVPDPGLWKFPVPDSHGLLTTVFCQNIVVTVNICDLANNEMLNKNMLRYIGVKCNLALFHAIALRVQPGCTVLIFATGKVVVSGSKSIEDMNCGSLTAVHILNNMRIGNFHIKERRITNIVGTAYLPPGHKLDFKAIHDAIPLQCVVAALFAGMFVFMPDHATNFILFRSGAIVVCSRAISLMTSAITSLEEIVLRCNAVRVAAGVESKVKPALAAYTARQRLR
jgi:TATA-box binding protein (TBP) (component of TFIID and TFIIIB)